MLKIFILFKLRVSNDCVLEVVVSVIRVVNVKVKLCKVILFNGIKVWNIFWNILSIIYFWFLMIKVEVIFY